MLKLNASLKEELLALKTIASQKRLERGNNNFLSSTQVSINIARWLPTTNSLLLIEALKNDLTSMPIYDCLTLWLDCDRGLASQFPQEILNIAKQLLPEEKEGEKEGEK